MRIVETFFRINLSSSITSLRHQKLLQNNKETSKCLLLWKKVPWWNSIYRDNLVNVPFICSRNAKSIQSHHVRDGIPLDRGWIWKMSINKKTYWSASSINVFFCVWIFFIFGCALPRRSPHSSRLNNGWVIFYGLFAKRKLTTEKSLSQFVSLNGFKFMMHSNAVSLAKWQFNALA